MLEMPGEGHGFIAVNFPDCEEHPGIKSVGTWARPRVLGSERGTL